MCKHILILSWIISRILFHSVACAKNRWSGMGGCRIVFYFKYSMLRRSPSWTWFPLRACPCYRSSRWLLNRPATTSVLAWLTLTTFQNPLIGIEGTVNSDMDTSACVREPRSYTRKIMLYCCFITPINTAPFLVIRLKDYIAVQNCCLS